MANPTTGARESERVAELARNAYPTAQARAMRALECGPVSIVCCGACRHRHNVGYFTSGPFAGEALWVCEIEEGGR